MSITKAYEEVIDFVAGTNPHDVAAYRPSAEVRARAADLVAREKAGSLTPEEVSELQTYLHLEHLMRLIKARAHQRLGSAGESL